MQHLCCQYNETISFESIAMCNDSTPIALHCPWDSQYLLDKTENEIDDFILTEEGTLLLKHEKITILPTE